MTVYEFVGGEQFFTDLTADFYRHVAADAELRALLDKMAEVR